MAILDSAFGFLGRLGNITAYRMKGSNKIILRTIGGAKKDNIKNDPKHANQRRSYTEFSGRGTATKFLRKAMFPLLQLGDYNFTGDLNALTRHLQVMDNVNAAGKRDIRFSVNPKMFEGFNLNKQNTFDDIIRNPFSFHLDKTSLAAKIDFPAMMPGVNFFDQSIKYPVYCFLAVLGIVPDVVYTQNGYEPVGKASAVVSKSEWYPVLKGSPFLSLEPNLASPQPPVAPFTIMLSAGICFGSIGKNKEIDQVKRAGAAKIVALE